MADLTITSNSIKLVSSTSAQGLQLYSGSGTVALPTDNPSGGTEDAPKVPAAVDDTGALVWRTMGGGSGTTGVSEIFTDIVASSATVVISAIAPTLVAPITAKVTLVGGGGGGAQIVSPDKNTGTGGGGGGATCVQYFNDLTPASSFIVTIGAGGAAGSTGGVGGNGGPTLVQFGADIYGAGGGLAAGVGAANNTSLLTCTGGAGGDPTEAPGATNDGEILFHGENGGHGTQTTLGVLHSGAGGGTTFYPNNQAAFTSTGANVAGINGRQYGCGGSGIVQVTASAALTTPGSGSAGVVIFEVYGAVA